MPLFDHFRPPVDDELPWDSLHSGWASTIAVRLNKEWLSRDFVALEHTHLGPHVEIDVGTFERTGRKPHADPSNGGGGVVTIAQAYAPPAALTAIPAVFPDRFEVRVFSTEAGRRLVGAIELVSPSNKDRPEERRAFIAKCTSYLAQGVSLVIIDIVTTRHANLHNELLQWLRASSGTLPDDANLYATAYRPAFRNEMPEIDVWANSFEIGSELPTMPLRLLGDFFVPIEFESTYLETCRQRRLIE